MIRKLALASALLAASLSAGALSAQSTATTACMARPGRGTGVTAGKATWLT